MFSSFTSSFTLGRRKGIIPLVPVSGAVLYLDPHNSSSYPGSGTTFTDLSGNGLNGTMSNVSYTSPAFNFNGTSSSISISDNSLLEPGSGNFTVEAWFNQTTITGINSHIILAKTDGGLASDWGYGFRTMTNGQTYMEVGNGTSSTIQSPVFTASANTWYQVVGVFSMSPSKTLSLYKNGVSQGTPTSHTLTGVKNTSNPLYLGSFNNGQYQQWLTGKLGVVRYYDRALSGAEILQNYNATKGLYGLS